MKKNAQTNDVYKGLYLLTDHLLEKYRARRVFDGMGDLLGRGAWRVVCRDRFRGQPGGRILTPADSLDGAPAALG